MDARRSTVLMGLSVTIIPHHWKVQSVEIVQMALSQWLINALVSDMLLSIPTCLLMSVSSV